MLKVLERVEFHEIENKKIYRLPFVKTQFYVSDIKTFLKLCSGNRWNEEMFNFNIERKRKSKAKRPCFDMFVNGRQVFVYPKENMVEVREVGLHYICQHSFDLFPSEVRGVFYESIEPIKLGILHTLKGENLEVTSKDIHDGFMLHREQVDRFKDSFAEWVRNRRKNE